VGTDLQGDHTVIDTATHRLPIGMISGAPANDRDPGDPIGSVRLANDRKRRSAAGG
jgi:hypothetical protein